MRELEVDDFRKMFMEGDWDQEYYDDTPQMFTCPNCAAQFEASAYEVHEKPCREKYEKDLAQKAKVADLKQKLETLL